MCTLSIKVNDTLLDKARVNLDSDIDVTEWLQQQINAILIKMAYSSERKTNATSSLSKQDPIQRIIRFSETDGNALSLRDLEGILPATQTSLEDLGDEYITEKYGI